MTCMREGGPVYDSLKDSNQKIAEKREESFLSYASVAQDFRKFHVFCGLENLKFITPLNIP